MATPQEIAHSKMDTNDHREKVGSLMSAFANALVTRAQAHDKSKLEDPELTIYAEVIPQLGDHKYGSPEHKAILKGLGPAWDHHKAHNSHHPEHHERGLQGMNLLDLVEMICDWKAASARNTDSDSFKRSVTISLDKFKIVGPLSSIIINSIGFFDDVDLANGTR